MVGKNVGQFWLKVTMREQAEEHRALDQYVLSLSATLVWIPDHPQEKDTLFDAIHTMPAVRDKARWAVQWMNREASLLVKWGEVQWK